MITKIYLSLIFFIFSSIISATPPDFAEIKNIKQKKEAFFNYLKPIAQKVNQKVIDTRTKLTNLLSKTSISINEQNWLNKIAKKYDVKNWDYKSIQKKHELTTKVDVIPMPILLAQAANESAWGTSRFARQGNNFFGQWCFTKNCGIIPNQRPKNTTYSVRKFDSVEKSVESYIHNLNTNLGYQYFRELRANLREKKQPLNSIYLTQGLIKYSTKKEAYIAELNQMIKHNNLNRYKVNYYNAG